MTGKRLIYFMVAAILVIHAPAVGKDNSERTASEILTTGTESPVFSLPDLNGNTVDMEQHLGRASILVFFWSIYCGSCVDEMISLQKLENKYQGDGLVIVAVNEDVKVPKSRIEHFIQRFEKYGGKITFPLLFDEDSRVFDSYNAIAVPSLILVDKNGLIAGHQQDYHPGSEHALIQRVESFLQEDGAETAERSEYITVTGEAVLCGFFDSSGWRKNFSGSESYDQELKLTRDLAGRSAVRKAVMEASHMLGLRLYSIETATGCLDRNGIHLVRDPFDTHDPVSNLLSILHYSNHFKVLKEEEALIDTTCYSTKHIMVSVDSMREELESLGYLFEPVLITITYLNMGSVEQKSFMKSMLDQSRYIGSFEDPVFTTTSSFQNFVVYTSAERFADEILGMDFGELNVFVEEVTPTSLELEVWK